MIAHAKSHPIDRSMTAPELTFSRRIRATPFESRVMAQNPKSFTVYNHMPLASVFRTAIDDYEHLCNHVQVWDVSCERQVEVVGKDARALVELVTPRDVSRCETGQCMYVPLVDENGGIVNDPVLLRVDKDRYWLSIADSGALLWLKGIAVGRGMDVRVVEPDVSPMAVQGPRADDLMATVVGDQVRKIGFFRFIECEIAGTSVVLARSGWSGQGGFELYLQDFTKGTALWDCIWEAGQQFDIRAGCPNLIERIESGLLSYGSDITLENNPAECGLMRFCDVDKEAEYLARSAMQRITREGVSRKLVHLMIPGGPISPPRSTYPVSDFDGDIVGQVTSLAWSPRFAANIAFASVKYDHSGIGTPLYVEVSEKRCEGVVKNRRWEQ